MPRHTRGRSVHFLLIQDEAAQTHNNVFLDRSLMPRMVARPPHATWYVRRVSSLPTLQALTCRLGAPAHLCDERAFSYPGRTVCQFAVCVLCVSLVSVKTKEPVSENQSGSASARQPISLSYRQPVNSQPATRVS